MAQALGNGRFALYSLMESFSMRPHNFVLHGPYEHHNQEHQPMPSCLRKVSNVICNICRKVSKPIISPGAPATAFDALRAILAAHRDGRLLQLCIKRRPRKSLHRFTQAHLASANRRKYLHRSTDHSLLGSWLVARSLSFPPSSRASSRLGVIDSPKGVKSHLHLCRFSGLGGRRPVHNAYTLSAGTYCNAYCKIAVAYCKHTVNFTVCITVCTRVLIYRIQTTARGMTPVVPQNTWNVYLNPKMMDFHSDIIHSSRRVEFRIYYSRAYCNAYCKVYSMFTVCLQYALQYARLRDWLQNCMHYVRDVV